MSKYIIDSHAHLDSERFEEDRGEIINRFEEDNILLVINPAVDEKSSYKSVELANKYEKMYAMVGTHPHDASDYSKDLREKYKKLALNNEKVLSIGEIGLDYHYDYSPVDVQKKVFIDQILLAKELDLPIVIHSREAFEDTYEILETYAKGMKVLLHSFNETWEDCQKYLELGFYISLGGMVTFKNAKNLIKVVENVPLDKLLLETDSPYLAPVPHRGKRNEPKYTHDTALRIARMRVEDIDNIRNVTNQNSLRFFNIKDIGNIDEQN